MTKRYTLKDFPTFTSPDLKLTADSYADFVRQKFGFYFKILFKPPHNICPRKGDHGEIECPHHGAVMVEKRRFALSKYGCPLCGRKARSLAAKQKYMVNAEVKKQKRAETKPTLADYASGKMIFMNTGCPSKFFERSYSSLEAVKVRTATDLPDQRSDITKAEDEYQYRGWKAGIIKKPRITLHSKYHARYLKEVNSVD